jgi:hypothetical protein
MAGTMESPMDVKNMPGQLIFETRSFWNARQFRIATLVVTSGIRTATVHPRIHDLRHSFAVHTLISWQRSGVNIDEHISTLSTYLGHISPADTYWYLQATPKLLCDVAEAAEESYPDEAIRLYKSVIKRLIDGRGRENYQQATGYLARVRQLYQKQRREPEWQAYITNLRNSNKSLRALKEELDKREL